MELEAGSRSSRGKRIFWIPRCTISWSLPNLYIEIDRINLSRWFPEQLASPEVGWVRGSVLALSGGWNLVVPVGFGLLDYLVGIPG